MDWFAQATITGITAFVATNIDDIVILMLFFSQRSNGFLGRQVVVGQYLGFCVLIAASLPGFFGGLLIPKNWIGWLGIVPIAIGIYQLIKQDKQDETDIQTTTYQVNRSNAFASLLAPQTYHVAAVTVANGGDNIGVYIPLFASSNLISLMIILGTFLIMVGVWCYIGYQLSCHPAIAPIIARYGHKIVPFVLIGLGIFILVDHSIS